jgi:hypothetical protein
MNSIDPLIRLDHGPAQAAGGDAKRRALRFALGFLVLTALVGAWLWWRRDLPWPAIGLVASGGLLLALAPIKPHAVLALRRAWLTLARYVGTFNTFLILTLLYFVAVVPLGFATRVFGRDRLGLRHARDATSYWKSRDTQREPNHFERPY